MIPRIRDIIRQPMLAPQLPKQVPHEMSVEDYLRKYVKYPALVSPKEDGIRCLLDSRNWQAYSRSFKPIPNAEIRAALFEIGARKPFSNHIILDGELVCYDLDGHDLCYNTTQSFVLSRRPKIKHSWQYRMFDCIINGHTRNPALFRSTVLTQLEPRLSFCNRVSEVEVSNLDELLRYEQVILDAGKEGVMIRHAASPYKHNSRCTLDEGYLLKLVRTIDEVATIVGFEEAMLSTQDSYNSETGRAVKSKSVDTQVGAGMLGAFWVETDLYPERFKVAAGQMSHVERKEVWDNRDTYANRQIIFRHKPFGQLNVPRSGRFVKFKNKHKI